MIDQDILLKWATAIAAVGAWIYAWWTRQDDKTTKVIADLDHDLNVKIALIDKANAATSNRLTKIETQLGDMPSKEDYHRLDKTLVKIDGQLSTMNERMKPIGSIAERLQEFLLSQAAAPAAKPQRRRTGVDA